jgi:predicted RNA-binding protein with PIN domain
VVDEPVVVLAEPVRHRLVAIASDVLGGLAQDEIPTALRPIARFTPAKRVRFGATAIAAALDGDESFRARVGAVVAESSPQLAEAVRQGDPTTVSDPIDTAVVAYLLRPPAWPSTLAEATDRWRAARDRSGDDTTGEQLAQLRTEVSQLKAQRRAEPGRVRDAVDAATRTAAAQLADIHRQLRARTTELRAAEAARDAALVALEEERRRAQGSDVIQVAERRRSRARIAELERALEGARRAARSERDVDDARLWLLIETLTDAAAGVRRELSLPAPSARPAETVSASAPEGPARRFAGDVAMLDRLLAVPTTHLIVDGYNVTKTGYGELALTDQRSRLLGSLAALAGRTRAEITVAFDGAQRLPVLPAVPRGVRALFSAADEIADDLIRRLVAAEPQGRPVVVVSSDQQVQRDVQRDGAWAVPAAVFLARVGQV